MPPPLRSTFTSLYSAGRLSLRVLRASSSSVSTSPSPHRISHLDARVTNTNTNTNTNKPLILAAARRKMSSLSAQGKRLAGKTIVVTGASSGIGRSVAQEFARTSPENLKLIITARRFDTLKQVAADINKEVGSGVQVLPVQLDVSKPDQVKNFVPNLPQEFRDIDILVNNAGLVKGVAQAPDIDPEDINVMFATNVTGLINLTQAVLPVFKNKQGGADGGRGDIINIGSIAGREAYPGGSIYCATKAAVRTFTDSLRRELIATRIRVIEIDPGQVETVSFGTRSAPPRITRKQKFL
jgi:3-hydroxy acid dehydrogenase/malonic semialdehyde reductase